MKEEICEEILKERKLEKMRKELTALIPAGYEFLTFKQSTHNPDSATFYQYDSRFDEHHWIQRKTKKQKKVKRTEPSFCGVREYDEVIEIPIYWDGADINITKKEITIYDEKLYEIMKGYGMKHKYKKLIKCWEGC